MRASAALCARRGGGKERLFKQLDVSFVDYYDVLLKIKHLSETVISYTCRVGTGGVVAVGAIVLVRAKHAHMV